MVKLPDYDTENNRLVVTAQPKEATTFAMVDPDILPDGLFTHITPGTKRAQHAIIKGLHWRIGGRDRKVDLERQHILGYDDLSVLIALMACALKGSAHIPAANDPDHLRFLKFETTGYRIAEECGWAPAGKTYGLIEDCLHRLTKISYVDHGDWSGGNVILKSEGFINGLLSYTQIKTEPDNPSGEILYDFTINTKITDNLIGAHEGDRFIRIDLEEYRNLSPLERLVYARLCVTAWQPTEERKVQRSELMFNNLFDKIYQVGGNVVVKTNKAEDGTIIGYDVEQVDNGEISKPTTQSRRSALRKALKRISEFDGWDIQIETKNRSGHSPKILIKRTFYQ